MNIRKFISIIEETSELSLDEESRMARAQKLGFTCRAYHGTGNSFEAFDLDKGKPSAVSGYAPHFSSSKAEAAGYAKERKAKGQKTNVLDCLLRIKKPFEASFYKEISTTDFKKITGRIPDRDESTTMDVLRMLGTIHGYERDKYEDRRMQWTLIYARLKSLGYDAITFPDTPADHSVHHYTKIVVLDAKNVRSIKARFDPAHADSSNLMA